MGQKKRLSVSGLSYKLALFLIAIAFFFLAFPNPLFEQGLPFFAWLLLIPLILLAESLPLALTPLVGFVWGYAAWSAYAYWLSDFHPMAGLVGSFVKAMILALVFPAFKLAGRSGKHYSWVLRLLIWVSWEYAGSIGYLGFPYGAIGYTQWQVAPLLQTASIGGVWFVGALVVFPAIYMTSIFLCNAKTSAKASITTWRDLSSLRFPPGRLWLLPLAAYALVLLVSIPFSYRSLNQIQEKARVDVLLIQPDSDPWKNGYHEYRRELDSLVSLTDAALAEYPDPDLIVWPETAFVPRIYWHRTFREDRDYWGLVRDLLSYLNSLENSKGELIPIIVGNHDARPYIGLDGVRNQKDYNAAILFKGDVEQAVYRKRHLVPFTEHFPYRKQLPFIYDALMAADTHFWDKGSEWTLLPLGDLAVATPICYEDSFGYITRAFSNRGADFFAVLSNDAWAQSRVSQIQHASMTVFRSVETRRPLVRSTASGETIAVAPSGKIEAWAPSMQKCWLYVPLTVYNGAMTPYLRWGDWFPRFSLVALCLLTLTAILRYTLLRNTGRWNKEQEGLS